MPEKIKSSQNNLSRFERKYKILFESSRDAIMILEPPTWKFTDANPATVEMFKAKDKKEFTTKGPGDVSPNTQPNGQKSADEAKKMINLAMQKGSAFFDWTHKRLNGEKFLASVLLTRVEVDNKKFLQATVRDISQQKEIETKLQEKIEELEKLTNLMVGRELKMIELKEHIKQLESGDRTKKIQQTWGEKFNSAIELEEEVIKDLEKIYITKIKEAKLKTITKRKIIKLIQRLVDDSRRHDAIFVDLAYKYKNDKKI